MTYLDDSGELYRGSGQEKATWRIVLWQFEDRACHCPLAEYMGIFRLERVAKELFGDFKHQRKSNSRSKSVDAAITCREACQRRIIILGNDVDLWLHTRDQPTAYPVMTWFNTAEMSSSW
ncbi:predicted protein [Pyrenophora tritici-repentis Pt-1C-BFP]|uniref:Uncharacterized protein n=1 Tax=Pyrenophora tritici-repentis (strain Pt-1C-BFP) TaxID=426418 RepID=B2VRN4_PYRTR|nr:uncharacterized protein PTRG_00146 [Pyrenophora tritici-repentis Pt-1C-BFP]EDU39584.1 predicted protein [Pyrenophora tritici-repentis Pt-1C-BFP]